MTKSKETGKESEKDTGGARIDPATAKGTIIDRTSIDRIVVFLYRVGFEW